MSFTTDERTENFLKWVGAKFEYMDAIPFAELWPSWQDANLGRVNAIDTDAVCEYGTMMTLGSPAPAVIVIKDKGVYHVLDGVQRLTASHANGDTTFAGYVVSPRTSLSTQHKIRMWSNARINGQYTPPKQHQLAMCVQLLIFTDGCSDVEVARGLGCSVETVREEIRFQHTSTSLEGCGYTGKFLQRKWFCSLVGKMADKTDFEHAPGAIKEFVRTLEDCQFRQGQLEHLVEEFFNVKRSARKDRHAQFQAKLAKIKADPEVRSRLGRKRKTPLDNVPSSLRRLVKQLETAVERGDLVDDKEYALTLAELMREAFVLCRQLVPRDLQYQGNRRSSIFDKG